ncbi:LON peptidase substrate-binding domain-containing protein [Pleionea sp. CnH1-48]|uniref:LON peptidase substrate-binding domain-containing protein n=1 Tax=Pleionea sp. CnH1-48 TaxID=2954494 RepID=UPI002096BA33|nr:LON peptidase substrate-binding domain-containing protein [Pleionea sp. CnH1-48]MCO7226418.1 LON peptidase substrate-binding domain-containing protein [Pleionea sp. CnH1-48]
MVEPERAVFPLNTVLFPGACLSLVIFEPRYLEMVSQCLKNEIPFVVSRLLEGREADSRVRFEMVGTYARISDFGSREDGLLTIKVTGGERVRLHECHCDDSRLNVAHHLSVIEPVEDQLIPMELSALKSVLLKLANLPDTELNTSSVALASSEYVVNQLAQLLPLPLEFKQFLLEENDSLEKCLRLYDYLLQESED